MKMRFHRHGRQFFFFTFCVEGRRPVLSRIVKGRGLCPRAPVSPTEGAAPGMVPAGGSEGTAPGMVPAGGSGGAAPGMIPEGGSGGATPRPLHGGGNAEVHTELLPAGEAVISVLKSLHARNPALTASDRVVMPDHVHFVLIVDFDKDPGFEPLVFAHRFMEETARDMGFAPESQAATRGAEQEARGARGAAQEARGARGAAQEARGARGAAPPVLWERRFWLVLSFSSRQLSAIRRYIRHNPARAVWKAEHPDRFARITGFRHPILDSKLSWSACGDLTLMGSPFLFPVRLTRRMPVEAQEEAISEAVDQAECGMIPVCGFLSAAEKELQQRLRASSHTRWIKMVPHGLPFHYDPSVEDPSAFAEGRMLVLSSFPPEIPVSPIFRENCELMNARILKLCGPAAAPINTSGDGGFAPKPLARPIALPRVH